MQVEDVNSMNLEPGEDEELRLTLKRLDVSLMPKAHEVVDFAAVLRSAA